MSPEKTDQNSPPKPVLKVEVYEGITPSFTQEAGTGKLVKVVEDLTTEQLTVVQAAITKVQASLAAAIQNAKRFEVEFGLLLGGKISGIVVSGTAEATFKIRLTWER
jgi:hypothetical protein